MRPGSLTLSRKFSHKGMLYLFSFTKEHFCAHAHSQSVSIKTGRASVIFFLVGLPRNAKQSWRAFTRYSQSAMLCEVRYKRRYRAAKRQCAPDARETERGGQLIDSFSLGIMLRFRRVLESPVTLPYLARFILFPAAVDSRRAEIRANFPTCGTDDHELFDESCFFFANRGSPRYFFGIRSLNVYRVFATIYKF